ncbi:Nitrogen permease regulator 2 [Parelaphostrongylus tenuis]|uniref:guanylate cyclase n=1 Tax=Parelaphostrongylus tenuis TaxID=148309 RepID=A0AAD5MLE5_PARTN|nr:Nitrogen permease regulator 2 [Parelaphostrongylus tenuis]
MGSGERPGDYDKFGREVISRMKDPPFNCVDDCIGEEYSYAAAYAGQLCDSVYLYARALNSTLKQNASAFRNGTAILQNIEMTFNGTSGEVRMGKNRLRIPIFYFDALDTNYKQRLYGTISVEGSQGSKKKDTMHVNKLWQIPFSALEVINSKTNERIAAMKHGAGFNVDARRQEIRQMRELTNDNLNRFIGFCLDGPQMMSLWKYCSRGSLNDIIMNRPTMMDSFFINALIRDIVHGLHFIHQSFLHHHGLLTSKCCLVDEHWKVKISSYGMQELRKFDRRLPEDAERIK